MPRLLSLLMLLCLTFNAHADSYITRTLNKPVPGGVAVVELGPSATAPKATYQGKPVLVVKEQGNWLAIVGIPLTVKPGNERISSGGRNLPFIVGYKKYPEQRITLKNKKARSTLTRPSSSASKANWQCSSRLTAASARTCRATWCLINR